MKRKYLLACLLPFLIISCGEENIQVKDLDAKIISEVTNRYPGVTISSVEVEHENLKKFYELRLSNGKTLVFNDKHEVVEVSENGLMLYDNSNTLPGKEFDWTPREIDSITALPKNVQEYMSANYPNAVFKRIKVEDSGFEIILEDNTELEFGMDGVFQEMKKK